jgi:hypothetical protein
LHESKVRKNLHVCSAEIKSIKILFVNNLNAYPGANKWRNQKAAARSKKY